MMTPALDAALKTLETSLGRAEREINEDIAYFQEAALAIRKAAGKDTAELGHDLVAAQSILGKVKVPPDGPDDEPRAQIYIDALRMRIADTIKLAEDAGYQTQEERRGTPDRIEVQRINHTEQLDHLSRTIEGLAKDIKDIKEDQASDVGSSEQQRNLVQYFVERVEIKFALIELNLKEVIELLGLGEAIAGLLRLVRSFVATVIPSTVRLAGWLKEKAEKLKPVAGAIGEGFKQLVAAVRKASVSPRANEAKPDPLSQEEAEAEAKRLILEDKEVPERIARLVRKLDFSGEKLSTLNRFATLTGLQDLNLSNTQGSGITTVTAHTGSRIVGLLPTQVSDITALAALTSLQNLGLTGTKVSDITALATLTSLQNLGLGHTQVSDITTLAALTSLQILDLGDTPVSDITALATLTSLQSLDLRGTKVSDITALATLTSLQILNLRGTKVTNFEPVRYVPELSTDEQPEGPKRRGKPRKS